MDEMSEVVHPPQVDKKHPIRSKLAAGLMTAGIGVGLAGSTRAIDNYSVPPPTSTNSVDVADFVSGIPFPILPEIVAEVEAMDPDKPVPDDILRTQYRTFIHNIPAVKLEIMPEALAHEPAFSRVRSMPNSQLHIVLLDGPYVDAPFLPEDIDDPALRSALEDHMKKDISDAETDNLFSSLFVTKWKEVVQENIRPEGKFGELSTSQTEELQNSIDKLVELLVAEPNPDELREEVGPLGKVWETSSIVDGRQVRRTYILVSTKLRSMTPKELIRRKIEELVHASQDLTLQESIDNFYKLAKRSSRLVSDTLDPRGLSVDIDDDAYPIRSPNLGTILRHEVKHAAGLRHPDTDLAVLEDLYDASRRNQAGEAWDPAASDERGYYFRITTPEGQFDTRLIEDDIKARLKKRMG